jgi:DNA-binding response OmpR family regulator
VVSSRSRGLQDDGSDIDLAGLRVLVVEDSWHVADALLELLQVMGAEVSGPAPTVAEAERLLSERVPDVAIVDFSLRLNERADSLINRLNAEDVSIILISGFEDPPIQPNRIAAFLKKPFDDAQLLATLRSVIATKDG